LWDAEKENQSPFREEETQIGLDLEANRLNRIRLSVAPSALPQEQHRIKEGI
jgi:hypothetical protein